MEEQSQEIIDAVRQYERDNAGSDLSSFFDEGSNVDSDMLNAVQFCIEAVAELDHIREQINTLSSIKKTIRLFKNL